MPLLFKSLIARFPVACSLIESTGILYKCRVSGVPEPAHWLVRQLCPSLSNSAVSDFKLIVLNYLWWDYLHYGTRPMIPIRTPPLPPRKPVRHLSAAHYWVTYITLTNNSIYYATFVKNLPTMQETWEDPLQEGMATRTPVFLPGESRWTDEPGGLQSMGFQRVGYYWATQHSLITCYLSSSKYFFKFICLDFWLCLVFLVERGLSLIGASGGYSLVAVHKLLIAVASFVVELRL